MSPLEVHKFEPGEAPDGTVGSVGDETEAWLARPFPRHPPHLAWPTAAWPAGPPDGDVDEDRLEQLIRCLFGDPAAYGTTHALVAIHRGRLVAERYGELPETVFGPGRPVDAITPLISWSMAKSITHALVGLCVADGTLDVDRPAPVAAWAGDDRRHITLQHLLNMRSGLEFVEDYVDDRVSHVIEMLFGAGSEDVATYAASFPLVAPPGEVWNYSSGTTNIVARIVGEAVGGGEAGLREFIEERLFDVIGMTTADPRFDAAGTFIGSSFVHATARDFARFGYLYLRGGDWDGNQILPSGWADHARRPTAVPDAETYGYGAHWWLWREEPGSLACHGYEGQRIVVLPGRDLVLVRLGKTVADVQPAVDAVLAGISACFPEVGM